jgi:hypothetical protein
MTEIVPLPLSPEDIAEREAWAAEEPARQRKAVEDARRSQYQLTADPLFFKYQAGEATEQEWLDARAAVVAANPYPEEN